MCECGKRRGIQTHIHQNGKKTIDFNGGFEGGGEEVDTPEEEEEEGGEVQEGFHGRAGVFVGVGEGPEDDVEV